LQSPFNAEESHTVAGHHFDSKNQDKGNDIVLLTQAIYQWATRPLSAEPENGPEGLDQLFNLVVFGVGCFLVFHAIEATIFTDFAAP
jgi:hypothetical protein